MWSDPACLVLWIYTLRSLGIIVKCTKDVELGISLFKTWLYLVLNGLSITALFVTVYILQHSPDLHILSHDVEAHM